MDGYIKLYRKITENPVFEKPELLQLFIYCLLKANHIDRVTVHAGITLTVKRGSFISGRKQIAKDLKMNESKVYRKLKILSKLKILHIIPNSVFSIITVDNYNQYQSSAYYDRTAKRTAGEQRVNTTNNVNKDKKDAFRREILKKQYEMERIKNGTIRS